MMSKICGHRGAAHYKPENTISGFEWCVKNNIEWAECDVQLTNENTLLIIHDETLDRTSNVKGPVNKVLKSELNNINVGKLSQKDFYFQKIPTLTELLTFCKKSKLNLNIEMKFYEPNETSYTKRLVKELLETIESTNTRNQILITSFNIDALKILRKESETIPIGILYEKLPENWKKDKVFLNAVTIHLDYRFLTLNQLKEINLSNTKAFVYTCNDPHEITQLWDAGLSGVITDDPLKFI